MGIAHGDNYARLDLADNFGHFGCRKGSIVYRYHQDVNIAKSFELVRVECVSQGTEMADHYVIQVEKKDCVSLAVCALFAVCEGPDTCYKYTLDFVFAGTLNRERFALDACERVVVGVVVGDGDDFCLLVERPQTEAFIVGVGDDGSVAAFDAEASVS